MTVYEPTKSEFLERAQRGNVIPVYREILADMETPVSAFKKVGNRPYSFLLESVEGGEILGRYSFLGTSPRAVFRAKGNEVEIEYGQGRKESFRDEVPINALRRLMANFRYVPDPALPPFCGGAVGYVAYDAVRALEEIGTHAEDDLNLPDLFFLITDTLLIFDHVKHRVRILANAFIDEQTSSSEAYDDAVARINALHAALVRPLEISEQTLSSVPVHLQPNFTKDGFEQTVERCKEYIRAGDIFQVVISQRFRVPLSSSPFDVYRALRAINPSPYMFFLNFGQVCLAGSSPEILVKLTGSTVQLRPIAGTRRRGNRKRKT